MKGGGIGEGEVEEKIWFGEKFVQKKTGVYIFHFNPPPGGGGKKMGQGKKMMKYPAEEKE